MSSPEPQRAHPRSQRHAANAVLASEGDPAGGWYILVSGRVGVFKGSHKVSEFSQKGAVFGEISSILGNPRSATLVALEECEVLYVPANLDDLVKHHPAIAKKIITSLAERLVKTTELLWHSMDRDATRSDAIRDPLD